MQHISPPPLWQLFAIRLRRINHDEETESEEDSNIATVAFHNEIDSKMMKMSQLSEHSRKLFWFWTKINRKSNFKFNFKFNILFNTIIDIIFTVPKYLCLDNLSYNWVICVIS